MAMVHGFISGFLCVDAIDLAEVGYGRRAKMTPQAEQYKYSTYKFRRGNIMRKCLNFKFNLNS